MGDERISRVVTALRAKGLRAEHSYPGRWSPHLTSPAAAVNLQKETPECYVVGVDIYGPTEQGGVACEGAAQSAKAVLTELGAVPRVGECGYSEKNGLLCLHVSGTWVKRLPYTVKINQLSVPYATSFTAKQIISLNPLEALGEGVTRVVRGSNCWKLTVEEMLPAGSTMKRELTGEFVISVIYPETTVKYRGCRWEYTFWEETSAGVRQVRVARTWKEREMTGG